MPRSAGWRRSGLTSRSWEEMGGQMKNVLILHGAGNDSQGNWFPWLKKELEKKGYKVWVPDLPNSEKPIQKEWLETVKDWEFDEESILIGHSSGATLILRILENLTAGIKVKKVILVAGPIDKGIIEKFWVYKENITRNPFNWQKIISSSEEFVLIYSENDPYDCGIRHGKLLLEKVGGKLIIRKGEGHFNLEAGEKYKEFPEILELIV